MARRLDLAADLAEIARMNAWLAVAFAEEGVAGAAAEDAKLCLNELVANAVQHGYPGGGPGRIVVTVERAGAGVDIGMEDDGIPFDPLEAPVSAAMTGLEDAQVGGYGIKLFREASHSARYERSGGRNRLTFRCG